MDIKPVEIVTPTALEKAMLEELQNILQKPLSTSMLRELEAMARASAEVLRAKKDPRSRLSRAGNESVFDSVNSDEGFLGDGPVQPFGGPAETFGAAAIRELVGTLKQDKRPPREDVGYEAQRLIEAVRAAKEVQDLPVAEALQRRLNDMLGIVEDADVGNQGVDGLPESFRQVVSNILSTIPPL